MLAQKSANPQLRQALAPSSVSRLSCLTGEAPADLPAKELLEKWWCPGRDVYGGSPPLNPGHGLERPTSLSGLDYRLEWPAGHGSPSPGA